MSSDLLNWAFGSWILVLALAGAGALEAQQPRDARVLVIARDATDPRVDVVREAVAFWNQTFEELGIEPVLHDPTLQLRPTGLRALENHAWQISRRAGRPAAGPDDPPAPEVLIGLDADIVILLSVQKLMPFAWPLGRTHRRFVAVPDDHGATAAATRNVIAHELGHALGLAHDARDPTTLMCQPCTGPPGAEGDAAAPRFLPLAPEHRRRLLALYPPASRPGS